MINELKNVLSFSTSVTDLSEVEKKLFKLSQASVNRDDQSNSHHGFFLFIFIFIYSQSEIISEKATLKVFESVSSDPTESAHEYV
jgi:hypothetical protein